MADVITKLVEAAKNLLNFMTIKKLALLLATGAVGIILTLSWEKRGEVWATLKADKFSSVDAILVSLTTPSQEMLKGFVNSDPNLVAVQILKTDFNRLIRDTIFFYSEKRELQQDFEIFRENKKAPTPLMAVNEVEQNTRMIAIINQQFVCVELTPGILQSLPSVTKYAKQICSISVPPRYGEMVGYITFYLQEPLDANSIEYYHNLARQLADEIYKKDIVRRP